MINEIDLKTLWRELDSYEVELEEEERSLREVWVKMALLKEKNEKEAEELLQLPELTFVEPAETKVTLNVGGQLFETTVGVLTRDPYTILAGLCRKEPVIKPDAHGVFYLDRDWWLFRHILAFLRSNILPNELETLKELYVEASFYRMESMQRAIEDLPLDQVANTSAQINTTWPGVIPENAAPLRRPLNPANANIRSKYGFE